MDSTEGAFDHELRQTRLSRFGRVLAFVTVSYVVLNFFASLWLRHVSHNRSSVPLSVSSVAFVALWLLLRGAPRSPLFVRAVELSTLFVGTAAISTTAVVMDVIAEPDMIVRTLLPDPPSARLGAPVSSDLEALLLDCLAKRPEDRPASANVLRERLRACATASRWTNARAAQWWAVNRDKLRSGGAVASASASASAPAPQLTVTRIAD
jgi:hypothetical protein